MFESFFCSLPSSLSLLAQANAEPLVDALPWYKTGFAMFGILLALVVLAIFLAKTITKSLRMAEYSSRIAVILMCIFVATMMVLTNPLKFGVDLRGGMNLIGSLNFDNEELEPGQKKPVAQDIIPNLIRRVDPAGVNEIMIRALGEDKIEVTIPSVDPAEADDIWGRLVKAGQLQFRIVASEQFPEHAQARELAVKTVDMTGTKVQIDVPGEDQPRTIARWYNIARVDQEQNEDPNPHRAFKFIPRPVHLVRNPNTKQIINMAAVDLGNNPDLWGTKLSDWCQANSIRTLQILLIEPETEATDVQGNHLVSVTSEFDETMRNCVSFKTNDEGGQRLGLLTQQNKPDNRGERQLAIVIDKQLHSAPNIQEPIYDRGRITGEFSKEEIDDLIVNLRSGKLSVALNKNPISKQFIESALGEELKQKGIRAIGFSFALVLVFMMFYYRFAGIVACIALLLNLLFILALIMAIRQPLTLTGLAGLVLTVGMSVDANVLIFERIREELTRGSALRMAIRNGFDKATTTIVDANVTTLITAIVLYVIGTEQIKGFAVTLILGILISMFTAIYCARTVFDIAERKRWLTKMKMLQVLSRSNFDFIGKRGFAAIVSVVFILAGLAGIWSLGPKILNHDLRGGSTTRMVFNQKQDVDDIRKTLGSQGLKHEGEEIEFTVAKLKDLNYPDRVFKVDSNLPAYDGEEVPPPYDQLADVLKKVFKGQLENLEVQHSGLKMIDADGNEIGAIQRKSSMHLKSTMLSGLSITQSALMIQDSGNLVSGDKKQETPDLESPNPGTPEQGSTGEVTSQDQPSISAAPGLETQGQGESAAAQGNMEAEAANNTAAGEGDFVQKDGDAPLVAAKTSRASADLKFKFPISGKAIKGLISTVANDLDLLLEPENIVVDSSEMVEGDNSESFMSKDWNIMMDLSREEDAKLILDSWSKKFNAEPYFPTSSGVGGQIARDTQIQAMVAMIASLIGIIAYVWIRFQNVAFGLAAVIALIHDVLIVLGAIAISHFLASSLGFLGIENFKISLPIVAALLTIIGYSLNDTIVVFDRIREVRGKRAEITDDMVNTSICQTLSRTILTSITTFIVVFILYCFGGEAIHGFAFALVIGVIVGTYSSIFVASPSLLWLMNKVGLNPGSAVPDSKKI